MVNAWVSEAEIRITKKEIEDKINELPVVPSILASLWLAGSVASGDAMGTHHNITQKVVLQGGDYLMELKASQPILKELAPNMLDSFKAIAECTPG